MKENKHMQITAIVSAIIVLCGTGNIMAQAPMKLTVNEAIRLGLQNSGKLKISEAKIQEAEAAYHEAKDRQLPDVKVSGSYLRLNNPSVDLKIKTSSSSGGGQQSGGGVKVEQAAYGIANASIPLFSGFRIKYGIESAKYLEQASRLDAEKDKEEVIQNTINAYSNMYKAQKAVDLVKENLARDEQRVKDFSNLERNGLMARNDLLKAQLQQSTIELSLLDAENNLKMTNINMALMLGLPESTEFAADTTGLPGNPDPGSILQWEQTALEQRKDRAALSARISAAETSIKAINGEYYPGIALTGGYIAADVPNVLTLTNAVNAGIGVQYNIGSIWKTGAKLDAAKARLHQAQATESILADQVRLEVNQAYQAYVLSLKKMSVYQKSIEQANENYRITKNKYDNNLVTTTDLLDADVAQLQARLAYANSRADALVAYKKLQMTAGILSKQFENK